MECFATTEGGARSGSGPASPVRTASATAPAQMRQPVWRGGRGQGGCEAAGWGVGARVASRAGAAELCWRLAKRAFPCPAALPSLSPSSCRRHSPPHSRLPLHPCEELPLPAAMPLIQRKLALMGYPGSLPLAPSSTLLPHTPFLPLPGVGKSSLTQRFVNGNFPESYDTTIEDCTLFYPSTPHVSRVLVISLAMTKCIVAV